MIRIDRVCIYIIILGMIFIIPSILYITFLDELFALILGGIAIFDSVFNNNWKRYRLLWIIIGIITLYAIYSLTCVHFTVPAGIALDWIIELKTFISFIVFFSIKPQLTAKDKQLITYICFFNAIVIGTILFIGHQYVKMVVSHVAYGGSIIFISCVYILYCNIDKEGKIPKKIILYTVAMLTVGLLCTRSKYYGIYILTITFLFFYRPNFFRNFGLRHAIAVAAVFLLVLAASWRKIEYYFLTGESTTFDPSAIESFARPVLYVTGFLILLDFFPFGTGLGSFGTFASEKYYSDVYYYYGINNVWGISPNTGFFICDAYYTSLAQFGIVGVMLFIWFWVYIYNFLRVLLRKNPVLYRYPYTIGALIICFILIECTSGTLFTQQLGMFSMILLGMISGTGQSIKESDTPKTDFLQKKTIKI